MIDLHTLNRRILSQPVGAPSGPHVETVMWARDTFMRSVNNVARNARMVADALFPPPSHRPLGKALNNVFGLGIAHNSVADMMLHAVYVAACCAVMASVVGVAFGLTQQAVQSITFAATIVWHMSEPDGLLFDI